MTQRELIELLERVTYSDEQISGGHYSTFGDTEYPADAVYYGWNEAVQFIWSMIETKGIDSHPDSEADGWVFCGKCGKMLEV